jgi:hypothetical protein
MIVSLNEVESLTLKACRGAGMSWGLAEEAGRAACGLAAHGLAWDRSLVSRLEHGHLVAAPSLSQQDNQQDIRPALAGGLLCPIHAGAALSDLLSLELSLTLHSVIEPMWLLPFAARRARSGGHVVLSWDGGAIEFDAARLNLSEAALRGLCVGRLDLLHAEMHPDDMPQHRIGPACEPRDGIEVDAAAWDILQTWAARTYVPESQQSRLAGAGAGLTDND